MTLPDFVEREANLGARNTLGLPAHAAYYARIDRVQQLVELAENLPPRCFVLGGGSNLVLTDRKSVV